MDGNPDAPALEEGFYQEITLSKSCTFHESTPNYPPVTFPCFVAHLLFHGTFAES